MPCCEGLTVDCCNVYSKMTDPCYQKLCRIKRRQIYGECCGVMPCCPPPPCPRRPRSSCPAPVCCESPCPCCPRRPFCPTDLRKACCPPRCSLPCFPPPDPCCPTRPMIVRSVKKCCPSPCKMSGQNQNNCPCPMPCCNPFPPCCVVVQPCQPKCAPSPCCPPPPGCPPSCPQPDPRCCPKPLVVSFSCPTSVTPMNRNNNSGCGGRERPCCRPRWDESPPRKCQPCWSVDFPCLPQLSQRYDSWICSVPPVVDTNLFASRLSSRADNAGCQIIGVEPPPECCC